MAHERFDYSLAGLAWDVQKAYLEQLKNLQADAVKFQAYTTDTTEDNMILKQIIDGYGEK